MFSSQIQNSPMQGTVKKIDSIQAKSSTDNQASLLLENSSLLISKMLMTKDAHDTNFHYVQPRMHLLYPAIELGMFQGLFTYILLVQ